MWLKEEGFKDLLRSWWLCVMILEDFMVSYCL